MIYFIIGLLLAIIIIPGLWVKFTIRRYSEALPEIPGTGAELVRHLAGRFSIPDLQVEQCEDGQDHYSPHENVVRLSPNNFNSNSVSAISIAAHEFGHVLQYSRQEKITTLRDRFTPIAILIEKAAIAMISIIPLISVVFKLPQLGILSVICGLAAVFVSVLLQLIILPMEWDASFNKALPIIIEGNYLDPQHIPACRRILIAAAMTYVSATLASVLNIWRWLAILRR